MADGVLEIRGLSYRYPNSPAPALDRVTLAVEPGEFVVLGGCSGSGKTTLLRAACGLVPHFHGGEFAGEVLVAGRPTREAGPAELATSVGFVSQEPESQVVSTTVAAELELPLELRGVAGAERARTVEEAALALGVEHLLGRTTDSLSGGELQRVAIGTALVTRPPLLLLDEPTSQLDPVAGDELVSLLRRLNEEWGVAVLLGEHRLERCLAAADRVLAMRAGAPIYDGDPGGFGAIALERVPELATAGPRLFSLAGRPERPVTVKAARAALPELGAANRPTPERAEGPPSPGDPSALEARALAVELGEGRMRRRALDGAELRIRRGERVALMGANGAGKSTLLRCAAGLLRPAAGEVEVGGGCALLSQRPDDYLVRERVGEELPGPAGERALRTVGLAVDPGADPRDLSGGERQRLALAIAMAGRGAGGEPPALVCLDEPTRGLDRLRKDELSAWLSGLADRGAAVLVATHDVEFAATFAERVVLLARGRVLADGALADVLAGGWYFATETARITGGLAVTPEAGAELLREAVGEGAR